MMSPKILSRLVFLLLIGPIPVIAMEKLSKTLPGPETFTDLNLRMSNRPLIPPKNLIVQTVPLTNISVATPFVAPSPQAVIIENDQRHRVAILSLKGNNQLTLFLLEPLPLDPKLPTLFQCAKDHHCQTDRTPLTGGLGCVALCLKELLETVAGNPPLPQ